MRRFRSGEPDLPTQKPEEPEKSTGFFLENGRWGPIIEVVICYTAANIYIALNHKRCIIWILCEG